MAYQPILLGTTPDDGTGDSPRAAGDKINDNFVELYAITDAAPFGAYFVITQTDYSTSTIYQGGNWSDDNRWQISKFVAGVMTRATILNNGSYANLAAAWAAKASLTYA